MLLGNLRLTFSYHINFIYAFVLMHLGAQSAIRNLQVLQLFTSWI